MREATKYNLVIRILVIPVCTVICHYFSWFYLRKFNTDILFSSMKFFGLKATRTSPALFRVDNHSFFIGTSCTSIDVYLSSIPLLWKLREATTKQLKYFFTYFVIFFSINQLRLLFGFVLYNQGVSWTWAHEIPSGLFLFGTFLWIVQQRRWSIRATD